MSEIRITRAENRDQPALHRLWGEAFGDPPEMVEAFFSRFPPEAAGWIARQGDTICSAAYLLPGNWLLCGDHYQPTGYVYAVATAKPMRGRGCAGALMQAMAEEADERGLLLYTRPAEERLFAWYAEKLGAVQTASVREMRFTSEQNAPILPVEPLSPALYGARREALLADRAHVLLSENLLRLQLDYSVQTGGLYAVGNGCCACEVRDGEVYLLETIGVSARDAAQALLLLFGRTSACARIPGSGTPVIAYRGEALPPETHWGLFLE